MDTDTVISITDVHNDACLSTTYVQKRTHESWKRCKTSQSIFCSKLPVYYFYYCYEHLLIYCKSSRVASLLSVRVQRRQYESSKVQTSQLSTNLTQLMFNRSRTCCFSCPFHIPPLFRRISRYIHFGHWRYIETHNT